MTNPQLPERPNLEQLKHRAKSLLRAARAHDNEALARFRILPANAGRTAADLARLAPALHDAQSVIAREHGFPSWNALREHVEELALQFAEAVDEFVRAATSGRPERARRLLGLHPGIARANLQTALLLGHAGEVAARLDRNPALATQRGGARDWEPILYLCHSAMPAIGAAPDEGLVAIAQRLLAAGVDPNARFPWTHHGVRRAVLWGAVLATRSLALARVLLEAGANPNDGVTLPIAASGGDCAALDLLHVHGAEADQPWATDGAPTLTSVIGWGTRELTGIRWLLEHGARANATFGALAETALHVAARKGGADLIDLLVRHGADANARRTDGRTPYAIALTAGNRAAAEALVRHGAAGGLSEVDRLVAACAGGDQATAAELLAARPALRTESAAELEAVLREAAERGDRAVVEIVLASGVDPTAADENGRTPLHAAAMAGWPEIVRLLLEHGASVAVCDREFHAPPLIWAAEGSRSVGDEDGKRDHAAVGRLLLAAGSTVAWQAGEEPAEAIAEIVDAWRTGE